MISSPTQESPWQMHTLGVWKSSPIGRFSTPRLGAFRAQVKDFIVCLRMSPHLSLLISKLINERKGKDTLRGSLEKVKRLMSSAALRCKRCLRLALC